MFSSHTSASDKVLGVERLGMRQNNMKTCATHGWNSTIMGVEG